MTTKAEKDRAAKAEVEEAKKLDEAEVEEQAAEEEPSEQNTEGPVATDIYEPPEVLGPPTVLPTGDPQVNPHDVDDGVQDVELGPPVVGGWVQITGGDYAGHFAAYLAVVSYEADDATDAPRVPAVIQVRTRDADNVIIDLPYADVTSTTYSGGR